MGKFMAEYISLMNHKFERTYFSRSIYTKGEWNNQGKLELEFYK